MTLEKGLDSADPPTLQQAQEAKRRGYTWWGFYLPRLPNTDPLNGWTPDQVNILRHVGIAPVPICVPAPPHPADAAETATVYMNIVKQYGLNPTVAVCYNGEHIVAQGPVWLPTASGVPPVAVGAASAIQWGGDTILGLGVDLNASAPDFPKDASLVCDLEYNVQYSAEWYQQFQQTVSNLAKPTPQPTTGGKMNLTPEDIAAIELMMRQEFAPNGEIYNRIREAVNDTIQQNIPGIVRAAKQ